MHNTLASAFDLVRASESEAEMIWDILHQATEWLSARGLQHWSNYYTRERVSEYLREREVYLLRVDGSDAGTITLLFTDDDLGWYSKIAATYANALAVLPAYHGRGIASALMELTERVAKERGSDAVRLDAVDTLDWLHEFYRKRGYREVGVVQRQFRYLQFEKTLKAKKCESLT